MSMYRKKPVVIEAITFKEFIEYGKNNGANIVNDMPWSFVYNGHPITHENDECYLIPTLEGTHNFTPQDMLITGVNGEIYPCKKDIFKKTYELVEENESDNGQCKYFNNSCIREFCSVYQPIKPISECKYFIKNKVEN